MLSALKRRFRPNQDLYQITIAAPMGSTYADDRAEDEIEDDCQRMFTVVYQLLIKYAKKPEHLTVSFSSGMLIAECHIRLANGAVAVILKDRLSADLDDMNSVGTPRISLQNLSKNERWAELNAPERN